MLRVCVMAQRMCQDLGPNIRERIPIEHKRILLIMYEAWQPTRRNTLWQRLDHVFSRDTYAFVHSILSHPDKPERRREVRALQAADGTYLRQPLQTHSPSSFSPAKNPKNSSHQWDCIHVVTGTAPRSHAAICYNSGADDVISSVYPSGGAQATLPSVWKIKHKRKHSAARDS